MPKRPAIPKLVETEVLTKCHRRCCLCVYLNSRDEVRKGQIAHLNQDPRDNRIDNLVYLCLEHHDDFDSKSSQSKRFTASEVRHHRDRLYERNLQQVALSLPADEKGAAIIEGDTVIDARDAIETLPDTDLYARLRREHPDFSKGYSRRWRFCLTQTANEPELFAYLAGNHCDGICVIERIDLPDGRIVIACVEPPGNPGQSVTNAVEELAFQVCERFHIPADRLVWLEHYDLDEDAEWNWVSFKKKPPESMFDGPTWITMTADLWNSLLLRPRKRMHAYSQFALCSKLEKLFPWP
jgi:hypothetical protein